MKLGLYFYVQFTQFLHAHLLNFCMKLSWLMIAVLWRIMVNYLLTSWEAQCHPILLFML